ncbi:MAG: prenyltransferase [Chloroflexi bacterium]|nr:prenyltransferase [Chloroflexota bacterium]
MDAAPHPASPDGTPPPPAPGHADGARPGAVVRDLLAASRPLSWVNTALPFAAAAYAALRGVDLAVLLGFLYFLVPFNLLMYGVNDIFDYPSDVANPRKRSVEGGLLPPDRRRATWVAVAVTNVPLLLALAVVAPPAGTAVVLLAALAAVVYSAPPLRTKERPLLDSLTSSSHFVLPAVAGFLVGGMPPAAIPWPLVAAFFAWGVASHAVGAVQDIAYDRAAGIGSIATAAGPRATAWLALACYALAAAIPLAYGPLGVLAALALAPYLLLPLSILCDPSEAQARRAWRSFLGLNFLAGFVITQALLAAWGFYTSPVSVVIVAATCLAAGVPLLMALAAEASLRLPTRAAPGAVLPPLTVVVPCRDEAARLPALLASVAGQDHPDLAIVVADDGSTDGSAAVARAELARLRPGCADVVMTVPPKPDGWAGKSWACDRAAATVATPHLLFLDADTTLTDPSALTRLATEQLRTRAGLVTGVTRYAMPTFAEQACIPQLPMTILGLLPLAPAHGSGGHPAAIAFAYGPLLFVDRAAYARCGGHAATPGSEREDVDLARTFVRAGDRVRLVRAAPLAATRHYPDGVGALAAWRRVFVAYGGGSFAVAIASLGLTTVAWLLPCLLPLAGAIVGDPILFGGGLVALGLVVVFRLLVAIRERMPLRTVLWHPLTVSLTTIAQVASLVDAVRGRPPRWRGRPFEGART